jgi:hypothetical protein
MYFIAVSPILMVNAVHVSSNPIAGLETYCAPQSQVPFPVPAFIL